VSVPVLATGSTRLVAVLASKFLLGFRLSLSNGKGDSVERLEALEGQGNTPWENWHTPPAGTGLYFLLATGSLVQNEYFQVLEQMMRH
jgi:hypothetical protein